MKLSKMVLVLVFLASTSVLASDGADLGYLQFGKPQVEEVSPQDVTLAPEVGAGVGDIIGAGRFLWDIVKENRPVATMSSDLVSALPRNVKTWQDLQGWSKPQDRAFKVTYKNSYNVSTVEFVYQIHYMHSGTYNGQGRYLAQVTVIPTYLKVLWGYRFNAQGSIPEILNLGTEKNPIAGMNIFLNWSVSTVVKHEQVTRQYTVQGDGLFVPHP